jgi:copper transport protein
MAMKHAETRAAELARFSRAIPLAVAVLVVSGFALAVIQLGALQTLWTTNYGRVLLAKLATVSILLAAGAWNRYWLTPRILNGDGTAARNLSTSIRIEIVLVAIVIAVVALWRFTPPPRSTLAVAASPIQIHIHTSEAMADIKLERQAGGGRTVTIALWDGNFAPLAAKEVVLELSKPDAGIEAVRMPARYVADTSWQVANVRIPTAGRWRVRVEVLVTDFEKRILQSEADLEP